MADLVTALAAATLAPHESVRVETALVTAVNADGTVTVDLAGGALVLPRLASYAPTVGDAVAVLAAPGQRLILGTFA